jgi:hypothetical protein
MLAAFALIIALGACETPLEDSAPDIEVSRTPETSNPSVPKSAQTQESLTFTLTNDPPFAGGSVWKVYTEAEGVMEFDSGTGSNGKSRIVSLVLPSGAESVKAGGGLGDEGKGKQSYLANGTDLHESILICKPTGGLFFYFFWDRLKYVHCYENI